MKSRKSWREKLENQQEPRIVNIPPKKKGKMKKFILKLLVGFVIVFPTISFAQIWVARYNGPGNDDDKACAIAVDGEGNVYVTGCSDCVPPPYYSSDYATVKYNSSGDTLWVARYDGPGVCDYASAITVDGEGNVYVTGCSEDYKYDYTTIKYNSSGDTLWIRRYNGPVDILTDYAKAIAVDNSGNVYVTGWSDDTATHSDYATVKYNSLGEEQWVARYNGPVNGYDRAYAIAMDDSGNVYVTGESSGGIPITWDDYATVKYNSLGEEQWVKRYNGPESEDDNAYAIAVDGSGNVYVTGKSEGLGTYYDYATIKYNSSGVQQWVVRYNHWGDDGATAITVDEVGNVYVTGGSAGSWDYATVKYNSSGVEQWVARYNGPANGNDKAYAIAVDDFGNVYVTGYSDGLGTGYDYTTIKYNSSGVEEWVERYNGPGNGTDYARAIAVDGEYVYVTGESYDSVSGYDYVTIKYSCVGIEEDSRFKITDYRLEIYPNPFTEYTAIELSSNQAIEGELKIYDLSGRLVKSFVIGHLALGKQSVSIVWDRKDNDKKRVASGVYFCKLEVAGKVLTKKMCLVR